MRFRRIAAALLAAVLTLGCTALPASAAGVSRFSDVSDPQLAREVDQLYTVGIINAVGSTIAREADTTPYTYAGPEIAVASTKAYTVQCTLLCLLDSPHDLLLDLRIKCHDTCSLIHWEIFV